MPKVKTNRAAAKRFEVSDNGKLIRNKAYKSRALVRKSAKRKGDLKKNTVTGSTSSKAMRKILPYL